MLHCDALFASAHRQSDPAILESLFRPLLGPASTGRDARKTNKLAHR